MRCALLAICLLAMPNVLRAAEVVVTGKSGQISSLRCGSEYLEFSAGIRLPRRGWQGMPGLGDARNVRAETSDEGGSWQGRIPVTDDTGCRFVQTLRETPDGARLSVTVTAEQDLDVEGVFFFVNVPVRAFAGGPCELTGADGPVAGAELPVEQPRARHFLAGEATGLTMASADGARRVAMEWDRPLRVTVQDTREWGGGTYNPFITIAPGAMKAGQTESFTITFAAQGTDDASPARATADVTQELYPLDGFGGNYCFAITSPVTQYTLDNLNVRWARVECRPADWGWHPGITSEEIAAADTPGSELRRRMEVAQQLHARGIPYVMSVWYLPEPLYETPGKDWQAHARRVPREKRPMLLECLGAYLLYGKETYGIEPDLFSFNEPDYGVRVKLTPEEHRDINKDLGAHFESLGLKTKMLLADLANASKPLSYVDPTVEDPEAFRHVGALAYHSWGGATPERYAEWGALAERLGLPLLVTELGVDGNWREVPIHTFHYALREVRQYQELLLHGRIQGTMQWEFTADYSTVDVGKDAAGQEVLTPTKRFWFVKHFCNLTPTPGVVVRTESDHDNVLMTGIRGEAGYAFHVANIGAGRRTTIAGIPPGRYRAVRTSETEDYAELAAIDVGPGDLTLDLAPNSLLTLVSAP